MLIEEVELIVRILLVGGEAGRRWVPGLRGLIDVWWNRERPVDVNAEQFGRRLRAHHVRDHRAPITALCHEPCVPETLHQCDPGPCDARRIPTGRGGLSG